MKILLVHNHYRRGASGESTVFEAEKEMLRKREHRIFTYERTNDEIDSYSLLQKSALLLQTAWSFTGYQQIKSIIKKEKPDLAHFHNTLPLISPAAYYACRDLRVPVVQTVHNYRIVCANGLFLRDKKLCMSCLKKSVFNALIYGCYRNSRIQTAAIVFMQILHRYIKTYWNRVNLYIVPTQFVKNIYMEVGLPSEKIRVKPHFVSSTLERTNKDLSYVAYIGRLVAHKGIMTVVKAWKDLPEIPLKIVGDGPMRYQIEAFIKKNRMKNIQLTGYLPWKDSMEIIANSSFVVMPSEFHESFGCVIIEAYSLGKPVIASDIEPICSLVRDGETGLIFKRGSALDLANKVKLLSQTPQLKSYLGERAYYEFKNKYSEEENYKILMKIYSEVL